MKSHFIEGAVGPLFAIYHGPAQETVGAVAIADHAVLYIPAFAEEMNRTRRMVALQARAFASQGIGTLLLDLSGTGDSAGDFHDARWDVWLEDIAHAADWLRKRGAETICLWGLRLGALLACAAAQRRPGWFDRLLLWQPVTSGALHLTQFLRVRIAAGIAEGRPSEKTETLRAKFAAGQSVEVAGYNIAPELAQALSGLRLESFVPPATMRVDWLEAVAKAEEGLASPSNRVLERWRAAGVGVSAYALAAEPFWAFQETTIAPEFLVSTMALFKPCPA